MNKTIKTMTDREVLARSKKVGSHVVGGVKGGMDANEQGRSTFGGAVKGALLGSAGGAAGRGGCCGRVHAVGPAH